VANLNDLKELSEMDRWGEEGTIEKGPKQPMGNVAKLGMGGFVKANAGTPVVPW
jgi:hypothetical protein